MLKMRGLVFDSLYSSSEMLDGEKTLLEDTASIGEQSREEDFETLNEDVHFESPYT